MYFPYLRCKQHELAMLRTLSEKLQQAAVVPVLEPVSTRIAPLQRTIQELRNANIPHILIRNPIVGEIEHLSEYFSELGDSDGSTIDGYCIGPQTTLAELRNFARQSGGRPTAIVHWSEQFEAYEVKNAVARAGDLQWHVFIQNKTSNAYRREFRDFQRSLIVDGFKPELRNKDYCEDEIFSDLILRYEQNGYAGFGDFLMVGERFRDSGGPAHAVCIHLSYKRRSEDVGIRHFVSDTTTIPPADTGGKFLEALAKLVRFIDRDRPAFAYSTACEALRALHRRRHFPQLGKVKELSMQHHVELMISML